MTCQVNIVGLDGPTTQVRALLDSASSTSFVTERLVHHLRLALRNHSVKVSDIGATSTQPSSLGVTNFRISHPHNKGKILPVEALIVTKITFDLPLHPVSLDTKWKHRDGLELADPEFGTPGKVDLLLGADIFSKVVFTAGGLTLQPHRQVSRRKFGLVLAGTVNMGQSPQGSTNQCYVSTITEENVKIDEAQWKFWKTENHSIEKPTLSTNEHNVMDHFVRTHCRDEEGKFIVPLPMKNACTRL